MNSLRHHYGADRQLQSTPIWSMGAHHQFGAEGGVTSVNNIQALREAKGWMRPELAKRMGTSPQQIERLEKSLRKLSLDWIDKAATAFGVHPVEIFTPRDAINKMIASLTPSGVDAEIDASEAATSTPAAFKANSVALIDEETVEVRRIDLGYSMGNGANIDDYVEEGVVRFDLTWLRGITRAHTDMLFVARGDGDSMSPTLINDDTVLIDTSQRDLNLQDRIWAVSVYGAGMIKRLRKIGQQTVQVMSDNKDVPPQDVALEDLHIVGRVVWVGRRV